MTPAPSHHLQNWNYWWKRQWHISVLNYTYCCCFYVCPITWIFNRYSHLASTLWTWANRKWYCVKWLTGEWPLHRWGVWQGGWSWFWPYEQFRCQWNAGKQQWEWHIVSFCVLIYINTLLDGVTVFPIYLMVAKITREAPLNNWDMFHFIATVWIENTNQLIDFILWWIFFTRQLIVCNPNIKIFIFLILSILFNLLATEFFSNFSTPCI